MDEFTNDKLRMIASAIKLRMIASAIKLYLNPREPKRDTDLDLLLAYIEHQIKSIRGK